MTTPVRAVLAAALLVAIGFPAQAELRPYRAEYSLRLGTAANSPRIGKAVQEVMLDCKSGWHIDRSITASAAFTPSLQIKVQSTLTGDEDRAGDGFRYRTVVVQNGSQQQTSGDIRRDGEAIRATIESRDGTGKTTLPSATLMPVAAVGSLVKQLSAGDSAFPVVMFTAEGAGEAFRFDVRRSPADSLPLPPPSENEVAVSAAKSWPVFMTVTRAEGEQPKPLMTVRAQVFDTGVLDRLVIDAGVVTIAAYLQSLQMADTPDCSRR